MFLPAFVLTFFLFIERNILQLFVLSGFIGWNECINRLCYENGQSLYLGCISVVAYIHANTWCVDYFLC